MEEHSQMGDQIRTQVTVVVVKVDGVLGLVVSRSKL